MRSNSPEQNPDRPAKTRDPNERGRRAELRQFLRSHREALPAPASDGSTPRRRRTPGLRREEVAERAGMSPVWYSWLEMGRPIQISPQTLERIAAALELGTDETAYLFALAGKREPLKPKSLRETVAPVVRALLDEYQHPACILGARLDFLATNRAYRKLFNHSEQLVGFEANALWRVFNVPEKRQRHVEWKSQVHDLTALFRRNYADFVGDPDFEALIEELQRTSPEFRALWEKQHVMRYASRELVFDHPKVGRFTMQMVYAVIPWEDFYTVVFCIPRAASDVALRLKRFLAP